ncbi:MAG: hypothetical protein AAF542_15440 [Pseudomonadota bacterium]
MTTVRSSFSTGLLTFDSQVIAGESAAVSTLHLQHCAQYGWMRPRGSANDHTLLGAAFEKALGLSGDSLPFARSNSSDMLGNPVSFDAEILSERRQCPQAVTIDQRIATAR